MIMSNYIDEAERRTELYNALHAREHLVLKLAERARRACRDKESVRSHLRASNVSDAEIEWLRRTGRLV